VHTLQRGESISKLAQMYYGNYKQFHIIAQFNGMDDATRVTVGQKIKVPKVAGLPFHLPQQEQKPSATLETDIAETPTPTQEAPPGDILDEGPTDEVSEMDEQVMAYRDTGIVLYNEGKYEDAVFELNKAIEAAPEDKQTRSYLAKAYFESGKRLFEQQDFKAARDAFESAYQYDPACDACLTMVDKSKSGPVLMRREKGIDLFNQNEYSQAIPELELYLQQRPKDTEIHGLLSKAYFQQALGDYNKGNFQAAQKGFEAALEYDTGCEKCAVYITKSLESFKEEHYNRGIVYFGKENLAEAVSEWQAVYDVDPDYKDVTANLQKAQQLLDKLEQIKKNSR
ncbi:MAG: tetratricopeptide repeat protein, partial [Desulfatitalea sp.]|nr:tetratricopeptide repeat protein [Desulfatitalea sp.]NNK00454.1 tetratricopeptide repeat protein [Desulfatitalea sp.]